MPYATSGPMRCTPRAAPAAACSARPPPAAGDDQEARWGGGARGVRRGVDQLQRAAAAAPPTTCNVTSPVPPTGSRCGVSVRCTRTVRRVARASAQRRAGGGAAAKAPTRSRSRSSSGTAHAAVAIPAASRQRPRVLRRCGPPGDRPHRGRSCLSRPAGGARGRTGGSAGTLRFGPAPVPAAGEQAVHQLGRRAPGGAGVGGEQQPVGQHGDGDGAHVVRDDEAAPAAAPPAPGRRAPAAASPGGRRPAAGRAAGGWR